MSDKDIVVGREMLTTLYLLGIIGMEELLGVCFGMVVEMDECGSVC